MGVGRHNSRHGYRLPPDGRRHVVCFVSEAVIEGRASWRFLTALACTTAAPLARVAAALKSRHRHRTPADSIRTEGFKYGPYPLSGRSRQADGPPPSDSFHLAAPMRPLSRGDMRVLPGCRPTSPLCGCNLCRLAHHWCRPGARNPLSESRGDTGDRAGAMARVRMQKRRYGSGVPSGVEILFVFPGGCVAAARVRQRVRRAYTA